MTRTLAANLNFSSDTFNTAFTDINHLLFFAKNDAMSANSTEGTTTGNAALTGTFTASNVAVTGVLRGGTLASPASLNVGSNVIFLGLINASANVSVNATFTQKGNTNISGNSTVVVAAITGNSTVSEATLGGTNLRINSNVVANGGTNFNNTVTILGNTSISGNATIVAFLATGNSTVTNTYIGGQRLLVNTVSNSVFQSNVFINGDLTVTGNSTITISSPSGNWVPAANATYSLGNSTMTWLAHLISPVIYTGILPSTNGVLLGNTTNRFAAAFTTANTSGVFTFGANLVASANIYAGTDALNLDVSNKRLAINVALGGTDALTVAGKANVTTLLVGGIATVSNLEITNITTNVVVLGTNTNFSSNVLMTGALIKLGNSTVGNVGIKNATPTVALHIGGNYQTDVVNYGTINSTSNNTISMATANYIRGTIGGAVTLTFSNIPTGNGAFGWAMALANVGSNVTWPAAVKWPGGTAPTFSSNTDIVTFITHDSGTTIFGQLSIKDAR